MSDEKVFSMQRIMFPLFRAVVKIRCVRNAGARILNVRNSNSLENLMNYGMSIYVLMHVVSD